MNIVNLNFIIILFCNQKLSSWFALFSRQILHPSAYSLPFYGWLIYSAQVANDRHYGCNSIALFAILWASLWHGSQKWVVPQQNQFDKEQQNLHLKSINSSPCSAQVATPMPRLKAEHFAHTSSSLINSLYAIYASSLQSLIPPKYASLHLKHW